MQYVIQITTTPIFMQLIHHIPNQNINLQTVSPAQVSEIFTNHKYKLERIKLNSDPSKLLITCFYFFIMIGGSIASNMHPVMAAFLEIMNDNYLRFIIFGLSAVLQTITTDCPTALVWHYYGENKSPTSLIGSPLDYLPRFVYLSIMQ